MSCDVGELTESLENELMFHFIYSLFIDSFLSNLVYYFHFCILSSLAIRIAFYIAHGCARVAHCVTAR